MAKKPEPADIPPLIDSADAREIFATEVVGAAVIGGCVNINLAAHRWIVPRPGDKPEITRVMVARLVLSGDASIQLAKHLAQLGQQKTKPVQAGSEAGKDKK